LKRNTLVVGITLFVLAVFAWAGWANWEYRKQATERREASVQQAQLVANADADAGLSPSPMVGKQAPAFTLEDLNGKKVSLSDFQGKALLINFWATWCGPCKLETPWLVDLQKKYAGKDFAIIGIDSEDDDATPADKAAWARDKASVAKFVKEEQMTYPVLLGGDLLGKPYGDFDAMPTSFYVDRSGKIIGAQMGITSEDEMAKNIERAIGAGK
jgi:thiol-disulfide isomerase/thioredoxin